MGAGGGEGGAAAPGEGVEAQGGDPARGLQRVPREAPGPRPVL